MAPLSPPLSPRPSSAPVIVPLGAAAPKPLLCAPKPVARQSGARPAPPLPAMHNCGPAPRPAAHTLYNPPPIKRGDDNTEAVYDHHDYNNSKNTTSSSTERLNILLPRRVFLPFFYPVFDHFWSILLVFLCCLIILYQVFF